MLLLILNLIQCRLKRYIKFNSDQIELRIGLNHLIKFIELFYCSVILYYMFRLILPYLIHGKTKRQRIKKQYPK